MNIIGIDMGLIAMSDYDTSVDEVYISNPNISLITHAHMHCEVGDSQENYEDNTSQIDDNDPLHD